MSDLGALPGGGRQRATAPFPPAWVPDAAPVRGEKGMGAVLGSPMGAPGGGRRDARTLSSSPLGHILGSWGTARVAPGRLRAPPHPPSPLPPPGATQGAKLSPRPRGRHCLIVGPGGNRISAGCVGGSRMRGSRMRAAPGGCRPVRVQASCCPPGPWGGGGLGGVELCWGKRGGENAGGDPHLRASTAALRPQAALWRRARSGARSAPRSSPSSRSTWIVSWGGGMQLVCVCVCVHGCGCALCVALCVCGSGFAHVGRPRTRVHRDGAMCAHGMCVCTCGWVCLAHACACMHAMRVHAPCLCVHSPSILARACADRQQQEGAGCAAGVLWRRGAVPAPAGRGEPSPHPRGCLMPAPPPPTSSPSLLPQCVDFEGFKLFLRSYLEAADVPDTLCHHLFRSFQSTGQTDAGEDLGGGGGLRNWGGGGSGHGGGAWAQPWPSHRC